MCVLEAVLCFTVQDFFSYDESSGLISPCTSQSGLHVVCSQLTEVVHSGNAFCQALGATDGLPV